MIRHFGTGLLRRTGLFLLLAPFLAGSVLFVLVPMVMTFALSLTQYDLFSPPEFIGAGNYIHFLGDQLFQRALYNSSWFVLIAVTIRVTAALLLALALKSKERKSYWDRNDSLPQIPFRRLDASTDTIVPSRPAGEPTTAGKPGT